MIAAEYVLDADFTGAATAPATLVGGSFTPSTSEALISVGVAGLGGAAAAVITVTIDVLTYQVGTIPAGTEATVCRRLRINGMTPGSPVAWTINYANAAAATFSCRPVTQAEYASLVFEDQ